jgi:hypothetical protein
MTLKTLADVRVLVRHLPEDRRTQPAWPASPHSLSKQPRGVYGGKRRFGPNSDAIEPQRASAPSEVAGPTAQWKQQAMLMGASPGMTLTTEAGRPPRHAANFRSPATHVSLTLMSAIASRLTL